MSTTKHPSFPQLQRHGLLRSQSGSKYQELGENEDLEAFPMSDVQVGNTERSNSLEDQIGAPIERRNTDQISMDSWSLNEELGMTTKSGSSSVTMAIFNFTNSIIGAGIMGLPYALHESGFYSGILLLIALTFLVDWSVLLLIKNGNLSNTSTYQSLVLNTFGNRGLILITLFQFLFAFGAMCAYMVIIGDAIPRVMRHWFPGIWFLGHRGIVLIATTLIVLVPLSSLRKIDHLSQTSAISLVAVLLLIISIVARGPAYALPQSADTFTFFHGGFFQAIGVMSFAFVCHHNSFMIFTSLKHPTLDKFAIVTHWSTGLSLVASLILAIAGYLAFTDKTRGNILNNFPDDDGMILFARLCFAGTMFLTYPLEMFVAREVLDEYFFNFTEMNLKRHYAWTALLTILSLSIALSTCDLGLVLELTGGFSATMLAFILPAACYIKLSPGDVFAKDKILPLFSIVFGVIVMILSTVNSIQASIRDAQLPDNKRTCS